MGASELPRGLGEFEPDPCQSGRDESWFEPDQSCLGEREDSRAPSGRRRLPALIQGWRAKTRLPLATIFHAFGVRHARGAETRLPLATISYHVTMATGSGDLACRRAFTLLRLAQARELFAQVFHLRLIVDDDVWLVRMIDEVVLVVGLRFIERLQRGYLGNDGSRKYPGSV